MRTKEQDIFMIYYSPKMYEASLRDLKIGEIKVLGYSEEYKTLYDKVMNELDNKKDNPKTNKIKRLNELKDEANFYGDNKLVKKTKWKYKKY